MDRQATDGELLFALDIGNTSVKGALRSGAQWRLLVRTPTVPVDTLEERLAAALRADAGASLSGARCVACSVRPAANLPAASFWRRVGGAGEPGFFGTDLPVPLPARVPEPDEVGTDRLLLALGGLDVAGAPCIVVSAGTAITVDLVDEEGRFAGGAIAPGFGLGAAALHERTAFLPLVAPAPPDRTPSTDTADALRAGVYWSCAGGVMALVRTYRQTLGEAHAPVVCTGSDAHLLLAALSSTDARHEPALIFKGMAAALSRR